MAEHCPGCGRPVATTRPECVYCGAPLSRQASTPSAPVSPEAPASQRVLLVLDLATAAAERLAAALGSSAYEAQQRVRRGGFQLHRALEPGPAEAERARLEAAGVAVLAIPERDVLAARSPRTVSGGRSERGALMLRGPDGGVELAQGSARCVVRGPITREYQTDASVRRVRASSLAEGYRIHVYVGDDPRPFELDPAGFDFTGAKRRASSSLLELLGWMEAWAAGSVVDAGFARLPPALAPSSANALDETGALLGQAPRRSGEDDEGRVVLDNLAQFRYYSGWRAAAARRLGR